MTTTRSKPKLLWQGLYTVGEAALYARCPTQTLSRWLYGNRQGEPVLAPELPAAERLVTFLDFVQILAIRAIRVQHKVPLQKIREGIANAEDKYGVKHPLAREHTTFLYGKDVIIKLGEDAQGHDVLVQVSGKHKHSRMLTKVVEVHMLDVGFNAEGLANQYRAFRWHDIDVRMNPKVRFGEPLVASCGYSAQTLWEANQVEGGFQAAARAYGVRTEEVEVACRYIDHLLGNMAA